MKPPLLLTVLACVALAIALPNSAPARLGETPEQNEKRYGKPEPAEAISPAEAASVHRAAGLVITIQYQKGVAVRIRYAPDYAAPEHPEDLSGDILAKILETESGGSTWPADGYRRTRADGKAIMQAFGQYGSVEFTTAEFQAQLEAKEKAATDATLKSF